MANEPLKKHLYKILFWQLISIIGLSLVIVLLQGIQKGYSALLGGIAYWLPTGIFTWRVSARATARHAARFMVAFMGGEVIKLFLSAMLFVAAINYLSMNPVFGMVGLIGAIIAFFVTSISAIYQRDQGVGHE